MKVKWLPAIIIFLGSYFPLALILLVQSVPDKLMRAPLCWHFKDLMTRCEFPFAETPVATMFFCLITAGALGAGLMFAATLSGGQAFDVREVKPIPNDLINYVFPYVASLMGLDLGSPSKFLGFLLFLFWMFLITYRSGQIMMNPVLFVFGWRIYEVSGAFGQNDRTVRVLSRRVIVLGERFAIRPVQDIHIRTRERKI